MIRVDRRTRDITFLFHAFQNLAPTLPTMQPFRVAAMGGRFHAASSGAKNGVILCFPLVRLYSQRLFIYCHKWQRKKERKKAANPYITKREKEWAVFISSWSESVLNTLTPAVIKVTPFVPARSSSPPHISNACGGLTRNRWNRLESSGSEWKRDTVCC